MQTSIVIRTFVADGRRLTLHVGGGITWKSDPAAEWDETVAKARGPLGAIGGVEVGMSGPGTPRSGEVGHVWVDGRLLPADGRHLSVFDRGFQLGDGDLRDAARPRRPPDRAGRARRPPPPLGGRARHRRSPTTSRDAWRRDRRPARGRRARRAGRRRLGPDHGLARRRSAAAACCRRTRSSPPTIAIQAWPVVPPPGRPPRARPPPRRVGRPPRPVQPARRRSRRRRAPTTSTPGSRRAGPAPTTRSS